MLLMETNMFKSETSNHSAIISYYNSFVTLVGRNFIFKSKCAVTGLAIATFNVNDYQLRTVLLRQMVTFQHFYSVSLLSVSQAGYV